MVEAQEDTMANRETSPSESRNLAGRDPFLSFRREMDRLFDDFLAPVARRFGPAAVPAWPSVDVHESEGAYTLTAELPGMEEKDIELNLRDNVLTLSGEKRQERKEEEKGRSYTERSYGRFQRSIPFDTEVDPDKVQAHFKNGVLTVVLPKSAKAQDRTRRIEVKPQQG